jgi:hypothetical protein
LNEWFPALPPTAWVSDMSGRMLRQGHRPEQGANMLFYISGVVVVVIVIALFRPALTIRAQPVDALFSAAIKRGRATDN